MFWISAFKWAKHTKDCLIVLGSEVLDWKISVTWKLRTVPSALLSLGRPGKWQLTRKWLQKSHFLTLTSFFQFLICLRFCLAQNQGETVNLVKGKYLRHYCMALGEEQFENLNVRSKNTIEQSVTTFRKGFFNKSQYRTPPISFATKALP